MIGCARNPCGMHTGGCHFADCLNNQYRSVQPHVPVYTLPPAPTFTPQGCICPPTSEKTCQSPMCPRKNHLSAAGPFASTTALSSKLRGGE